MELVLNPFFTALLKPRFQALIPSLNIEQELPRAPNSLSVGYQFIPKNPCLFRSSKEDFLIMQMQNLVIGYYIGIHFKSYNTSIQILEGLDREWNHFFREIIDCFSLFFLQQAYQDQSLKLTHMDLSLILKYYCNCTLLSLLPKCIFQI